MAIAVEDGGGKDLISTAFHISVPGKNALACGATPQSRTSEPLMMVTVASASAPIRRNTSVGAVKASSDPVVA